MTIYIKSFEQKIFRELTIICVLSGKNFRKGKAKLRRFNYQWDFFFFFPFRVELNASSILLQKTKVHNKARKRVDLWDKSQQTECRNYENGVISNGDVRNKTFLEGKIFRDLKFFCSFPEKIFHNFLAQNIFRQKLLFF